MCFTPSYLSYILDKLKLCVILSYTSPLIFLWCTLSSPCILYNKSFAPSCIYASPIHMSNYISIFPQLVHHVWHTHYIPNIFISNLIAPSMTTYLSNMRVLFENGTSMYLYLKSNTGRKATTPFLNFLLPLNN